MDLSSMLRRAASRNGPGIRFVTRTDQEESLSYGALYAGALRVLGGLQEKGVGVGNEVVIQSEDSQRSLLLFWGCILGGIIPVPLSAASREQRVAKVHKIWKYLSQPYLVCDDPREYERISGNVLAGTGLCLFPGAGREAMVAADDIAYIQFSSGSTGDPKGVVLTHANLICNIRDITTSLRITGADILINWMPLTHDMGMIGFHLTGVYQMIETVCIPTPAFIRRPLLWMEAANRYRATVCYSPNFGLQYFVAALERQPDHDWDLSCIRLLVNGAEPISSRLCRTFSDSLRRYGLEDDRIVAAYGLAEASVEVSCTPPGAALRCYYLDRSVLGIGDVVRDVDAGSSGAVCYVDAGFPIEHCSVRICNLEAVAVAENILGEIQIRGENVTKGYYHNTEASRVLFTEDGWLRTGDLGFVRDGRLVVTGRSKNMLILNGQNYYPADIERAIVEDEIVGYGKVAACGCPGPEEGMEALVVFVTWAGAPGELPALADRIGVCVREKIGIAVGQVIPVRRIPKTTSGKIMHFELVERYLKGEFIAISEGLAGLGAVPFPERLIGWVKEILLQDEVDEDRSFYEMGLDSISAIRLANRIRGVARRPISVGTLLTHCTVRELCRLEDSVSRIERGISWPVEEASSTGSSGLSLGQVRIWKECRFYGEGVPYNLPVVHAIAGPVDADLLEGAMRSVIRRHELLRCSFPAVEGEPVLQVHDSGKVSFFLEYSDLRGVQDKATAIVRSMSLTRFDLARPFLFRAGLIRLGEQEYRFVFVIHHIITDGWSLGIFFRELSVVYNSMACGVIRLLPAAVPFRVYVEGQRAFLASAAVARERAYWLGELKDLPEPTGIPAPNRLFGRRIRVEPFSFFFDGGRWGLVKNLALQFETTPFSIFMTLLSILLYRYTNNKDIVMGFDVSGRVSAETEGIMGYLLNTLCLRVALDGGQSFADVAGTVRKKLYAALENQRYPYELLAQELSKRNELGAFRLLVLYQNFYRAEYTLGHSVMELMPNPTAIADGYVDLLFVLSEVNEGLRLDIQYDTSLYGLPMIERAVLHIDQLLVAVSQDVHREISAYDYFSRGEREFFSRPSPRGLDDGALPVHRFFEKCVSVSPDAAAVYAGGRALSYRALNDRANAVAATIMRRGTIRPDDRIAFLVGRNENILIALLAILKCGAAFVALDPLFPVLRCEEIMKDSRARYLLTDQATMGRMERTPDRDLLINIDLIRAETLSNPVWTPALSDLAYVIYTSGSTGRPKGVMIEHGSVTAYVRQFITYFGIGARDVVLQQSSVSFDTMIEEIFPALVSGASIVIAESGGRDIEELLSLIAAYRITVVSTTPLVIAELNRKADERMESLRLLISGGDVLYPAYIDRLFGRMTIYNTYGPSEATVCVSYKRLDLPDDVSSIGTAIAGCSLFVLDENGFRIPCGCSGEIYIGGNLARGYLNLPGLTSERFIAHSLGRLYRSGDLGRMREDGEIEFTGRTGMAVKVRGYRVEPEEVERTIVQYAAVDGAVVIADGHKGQLTAFLVAREGFSEPGLRAFLATRLPYYMLPGVLTIVDQLPLTATGKIDRESLRANRPFPPDVVIRRDPNRMEELLIGIWSRLFDRPVVEIADNFFELGGDSIKATQLINQLLRMTGIEVQLADVFVFPTVWQLGAYLGEQEQKQYSYIEIG